MATLKEITEVIRNLKLAKKKKVNIDVLSISIHIENISILTDELITYTNCYRLLMKYNEVQ